MKSNVDYRRGKSRVINAYVEVDAWKELLDSNPDYVEKVKNAIFQAEGFNPYEDLKIWDEEARDLYKLASDEDLDNDHGCVESLRIAIKELKQDIKQRELSKFEMCSRCPI